MGTLPNTVARSHEVSEDIELFLFHTGGYEFYSVWSPVHYDEGADLTDHEVNPTHYYDTIADCKPVAGSDNTKWLIFFVSSGYKCIGESKDEEREAIQSLVKTSNFLDCKALVPTVEPGTCSAQECIDQLIATLYELISMDVEVVRRARYLSKGRQNTLH